MFLDRALDRAMLMRIVGLSLMVAGASIAANRLQFPGGSGNASMLQSRAMSDVEKISQRLVADALAGAKLPDTAQTSDYVRSALIMMDSSDEHSSGLDRSRDLSHDRSLDPWARPYQIAYRDGKVRVLSAGPDQKAGTSDDIQFVMSL